jgi:hypothetical protein
MGELDALDLRWLTSAARQNLAAGAKIPVPLGDGIVPHVVFEEVKLVKARLEPSPANAPREENPATESSPLRRACLHEGDVVWSAMGKSSARHCPQPIVYHTPT